MKTLFLHIGNFKTGSTTLQSFFYLNRNLLKKNNIETIYERNYFKNTIHNQKLYKLFNEKKFKKIKKYFSKISKKSHILISSEFFSCFSYDLKKIKYIKEVILKLGYKPKIIFYYRSDKSYLYSLYVQQLTQRKSISIDNIFEFKNKVTKYHYYFNKKNKYYYMSQNYNLNNKRIVKNWRSIFKNNFVFFKFKKKPEYQIFKDFFEVLKIKEEENFKYPSKKNVSRKIKFWNFRRIFYLYYLNLMQSIIFRNDELDLEKKTPEKSGVLRIF
tara:strand:- start:125 stop:937 length:813 start_codon:yes stop_codon:yes gene_type:complete